MITSYNSDTNNTGGHRQPGGHRRPGGHPRQPGGQPKPSEGQLTGAEKTAVLEQFDAKMSDLDKEIAKAKAEGKAPRRDDDTEL